jgi:dual specificity protein phosphatase-like protein
MSLRRAQVKQKRNKAHKRATRRQTRIDALNQDLQMEESWAAQLSDNLVFQPINNVASRKWLDDQDLNEQKQVDELKERMTQLLSPTQQMAEYKDLDEALTVKSLDDFAHSDAPGDNYDGLSCIYPGLYLSGSIIAHDVDLLAETGITAVLRVMLEKPSKELLKRYEGAGIKHVLFLKQGVHSSDHISRNFDASYSFINRQMMISRGKVLVHCHLGKERSVTIVLHFLLRYLLFHDSLAWAYCRVKPLYTIIELCVKLRRRCIKPPSFFRKELKLYEEVYGHVLDIYDGQGVSPL